MQALTPISSRKVGIRYLEVWINVQYRQALFNRFVVLTRHIQLERDTSSCPEFKWINLLGAFTQSNGFLMATKRRHQHCVAVRRLIRTWIKFHGELVLPFSSFPVPVVDTLNLSQHSVGQAKRVIQLQCFQCQFLCLRHSLLSR